MFMNSASVQGLLVDVAPAFQDMRPRTGKAQYC